MKIGGIGLKAKLMALAAPPVVLAAILALVAGYSVSLLLDSLYLVDHSNKVITGGVEIRESAYQMQTGMRGFLLTGDEKFLNSFSQGENRLSGHFAALKKRIAASSQVGVLEEAEKVLVAWKQGVAEPAIALRKEIGNAKDMNDMAELVRQGMARQYYEKFSAGMNAFIQKEKATFVARQKEQARERDPMRLRDAIAAVDYANMVIEQALQVMLAVDELQRAQLWYVLAGREEFLGPYQGAQKKVFAHIEELKEAVAENALQLKVLEQNAVILREWIKTVLEPEVQLRGEIARSKTMVDMKAYVAKGEDKIHFDQFEQWMDKFQRKEDSLMVERSNAADRTASQTRGALLGGAVVVLLIALVISYVLAHRIIKRVRACMELAEAITEGDLTRSVRVADSDEIGRLGESLNFMVEKLRRQIASIGEGVSVLNSSATQISTTVAQVAASASATASSVSETVATVEEVRQAARLARDKGRNVAQSAQDAVNVSGSGRKATRDTIDRINLIKQQMESIGDTVVRLSEHSQAIENIIAAVQDLTDQSNLLAVNASIEAARAGEQGKGFSVVAHEIKSLADQSKKATERIRTILQDTTRSVSSVVIASEQGAKAVKAGVEQSQAAGEAIDALAATVTAAAQAAAVIESTGQQQSIGMDQVSTAMGNIDEATRQVADGAMQLQSAANTLGDLGSKLKEMVDAYRVGQ